MNKLIRFITTRRISIGLILLLVALMYLSTLIPQRIDSTPEKIDVWRLRHADLLWLVDFLNLHGIYSQAWFAAAILFAALSLGVSSCDQLRIVRKKIKSTAATSVDNVASGISEHHLRSVARSHSYRRVRTTSDGQLKFIRTPWGYFGALLLHVGMTVVIAVSLYVALTARQGSLILVEGEQQGSSQTWNVSEHGLLASPLNPPGAISLEKVRVHFNKKFQPAEVFSDISITDESGRTDYLTVSINRIMSYHGMRIYHAAQYGNAFAVTFIDKSGTAHDETIIAQQPVSLTEAGYSDEFSVSWSPRLLSVKYFADADSRSMESTNPELVLRFTQGGKEVARTAVTKGGFAMLGEYRVQLKGVGRWSKIIFVDIAGMSLIFTGFAIIMLGGLLQYLAPPRELIAIRQQNDLYMVYWKAVAFKEFFVEERDSVATALQKETAA